MVQELRSLEIGEGVSSGHIKLSGQFWTLRPIPNKIRKDSNYEDHRKFYKLLNKGLNKEITTR
jgi:hypothetical protein